MNSNSKGNSWFIICNILTIIFMVLKLTGVIDWSWLWVLCPLWIKLLLTVIILIIIEIIDSNFRNKYNKSRRIKW